MDTKFKVILLLAVTTVNAGLIAVAPTILEGPSSRTILIGPDGSQISAIIPGGKIVLEGSPGPLLQAAPEVVAIPSIAHPIPVVATLPTATEIKTDISIPVETPAVNTETKTDTETISVDAAVDVATTKSLPEKSEIVTESILVETETGTTEVASTEAPKPEAKLANEETLQIVESSSTNSTNNETDTSTPAADTSKLVEPTSEKTVGSPLALSYPHDSSWFAPESELEGRYVPENLEKLFDDGAYKPGDFQW